MDINAVLVMMLFSHIADDYYLQGILAKMKQKSWWKENAPDKMYRYDYMPALLVHALSWSIMISLPLFFASLWNPHWVVYLMMGVNFVIHAIVDDLKANRKKINLIIDQIIHILQVAITWGIWVILL